MFRSHADVSPPMLHVNMYLLYASAQRKTIFFFYFKTGGYDCGAQAWGCTM